MTRLYGFLWPIIFAGTTLTGQSIDLFTLSGQWSPPSEYETVAGTATEITGLLNIKLPVIFKNEKNIWYTELTYNHFNVNSTNSSIDSVANPIKLHGVILQTGLVHRLDDRRALQLLFAPRLMGDFGNLTKDHLQLGLVGLYEQKFSKRLLMRFGALYNDDLFGPMLVPLIYLDWQLGQSKWFIKGLVPIYAKVGYRFSENFSAGISQFGLVTSYALSNTNYDTDYIERKSIDITAFGRYRISGNFHLEARFGYALSRDYGQYAKGDEMDFRIAIVRIGDSRVVKNNHFRDGLIANLRLVYNLPLE